MTRDDIISLSTQLAFIEPNTDTLETFLGDVIHELSFLTSPPLVQAEFQSLSSGTAEYSFLTDTIKIVYAIMHDELLAETSEDSLESYSTTWRTASGTPTTFSQDLQTARTYQLYPNPNFNSSALIPINGAPWGEDYPLNNLTLIYADNRQNDIPEIFALPFTFDTLAREFSYPSSHEDKNFSQHCRELSQLLYKLVGLV